MLNIKPMFLIKACNLNKYIVCYRKTGNIMFYVLFTMYGAPL